MANMHQNPLKIRLPVRRQGVKEATYPRSESKHLALGPIHYGPRLHRGRFLYWHVHMIKLGLWETGAFNAQVQSLVDCPNLRQWKSSAGRRTGDALGVKSSPLNRPNDEWAYTPGSGETENDPLETQG